MHPLRCPYRGNAAALRASRGVHNKFNSRIKRDQMNPEEKKKPMIRDESVS